MQMNIDGVEYITIKQAAQALEVTPGRIRQLIAENKIGHLPVGNINLVNESSLNEYAATTSNRGRPRNKQP